MGHEVDIGAQGHRKPRPAGPLAVMMIMLSALSAAVIPRRGPGGGRMELAHEFTVSTPIDRAWAVLTDVQRIAPCMPGAELTEVDGDTYHGLVKVKVGPITAQYKGTASFVEKDEAAHRAVLKAAGR